METPDLQVTGAFSEAAWSDLAEDAELGDCPSSSLENKPQVYTTVNKIKFDMSNWQETNRHTWIFSRLLLESVSATIQGWTEGGWALTVSSTETDNKVLRLVLSAGPCALECSRHSVTWLRPREEL